MERREFRILLLDTDPMLRNIRSEILTLGGYKVLPATHPEQAISRCKPGVYDAVLVHTGDERKSNQICEEIRKRNPKQLVVIVSSGKMVEEESCASAFVSGIDPKEMLDVLGERLSATQEQAPELDDTPTTL